ncbi:NAD(P)/FAD-dependent oxidoreductase [Phenylobacterium aquaticum]|uniref:NAD(P)/FAD-dependent oxidoreductase n=1 Tax=Phenylobacterium aquaticum TaxID=1763816 RepID=UPI0026EF8FFF|nr:NAD(P)/FAD-dependent oxidoreductase [Phenylobacterium aquaticum]
MPEPTPLADMDRTPAPVGSAAHVVIVGAGFAGLAAAQMLGKSKVRVTIVDRRNYHLFVPLLYQVATAALSPADIAAPIRRVLAAYPNIDTVLGEVTGVDQATRRVLLADGGYLPYDRLILATGSMYDYFGHDDWAAHAPGLKTIDNARTIRARLLKAFEQAEIESDPVRRDALLTTVVIGGGPTGVEMAGTIAELARYTLANDFRRIDPRWAKVILVEAGPRLLANFPGDLPAYATATLAGMGVELRLNTRVENIEAGVVTAGGQRIAAATIVWGAGIRAQPSAAWLGAETDRLGRIKVKPDLTVPGAAGVYALGDVAGLDQDGAALPALAQVAKQQGQHLGRSLRRLRRGKPLKDRPFRYRSRGDTAIIGRSSAVFVMGPLRLKKTLAWMMWALVHVYLLIGFDKRVSVASQWAWRYLTQERGARLIDM